MEEEKRPAKLGKWVPKKWRPEYEKIVAYSAAGFSNTKIVELMKAHHNLEYTKEHVSNILNTPQADEFREMILTKMREKATMDIGTEMQEIKEKAVVRLKEFITNDKLQEDSPFGFVDRTMKILNGLGELRGEPVAPQGGMTVNGNAVFANVSPELMHILGEGLQKANEVKKLHGSQEVQPDK